MTTNLATLRVGRLGAARGVLLSVVLLALGLAGCFMTGSKEHFMDSGIQKAVFDMKCEQDKLEVTELAPGSIGVRGCGAQTRYEYVTGAGWVLNADAQPSGK